LSILILLKSFPNKRFIVSSLFEMGNSCGLYTVGFTAKPTTCWTKIEVVSGRSLEAGVVEEARARPPSADLSLGK
jgi:hypothetical protein